jgi:homoserine dehydrogenase
VSTAIVLKLGSSVIPHQGALAGVAAAIRGYAAEAPVLAVVSAFAGETDRLLAEGRSAAARGRHGCEEAVATAVATGETASAAQLALALAAAGVDAAVGEPRCLITIAGARLDGRPASVSTGALERLLERRRVAIVPGFVGESVEGGAALLGRGGSDLSALLFARALGGARCRLVKDVDGVYEFDPAAESAVGALPRRFRVLSYATAARIAGRLVQPKAIRFARTRRIVFEVGALGGDAGTRVGPFADELERCPLAGEACA